MILIAFVLSRVPSMVVAACIAGCQAPHPSAVSVWVARGSWLPMLFGLALAVSSWVLGWETKGWLILVLFAASFGVVSAQFMAGQKLRWPRKAHVLVMLRTWLAIPCGCVMLVLYPDLLRGHIT